eukprot:comp22750_c1_seq1/m.35492 comp22750_c1_seq1/g.35492  ORF comp22750_c1_seq1/g.35492 comp22750_c1_seq1/m.35492 type:complete len:233 (-) comp22750_c1_seq1:217-915(-)
MDDDMLEGLESDLPSTGNKRQRKQFRFTVNDDIKLLREVIVQMPYKEGHGGKKKSWENVATMLVDQGLEVTARRCQEHADMLLYQFSKHDGDISKKSGTAEEHAEKQQLLLELSEMVDEIKQQKSLSKRGLDQSAMDSDYGGGMGTVDSQSYFREKRARRDKELELRKESVALERARLEFEREKMQFERWKFQEELEERRRDREEKEARLQTEMEERRMYIELLRAGAPPQL